MRISRRTVGLIVAYGSVFLDMVAAAIISPILPFYALEFGASPSQLGFLMAAYSAAQFISLFIMSRASDRWGRKPIICVSLMGSAVFSLAQGLADNYIQFLLFRAGAGLFGGTIGTVQAYVVDVTTPQERPRYLAFVGGTVSLSFLVGPGMGAGLSQFGLNVPMFVSAGFGLLGFIVAATLLREPRKDKSLKEVTEEHELIPKGSRSGSRSDSESSTDLSSLSSIFSSSSDDDDDSLSSGDGESGTSSSSEADDGGASISSSTASTSQSSLTSSASANSTSATGTQSSNGVSDDEPSPMPAPPPLSARLRYTGIVFVCAAQFMNMVAFGAFQSMFGLYSQVEFDLEAIHLGFIFSGASIVFFFAQTLIFNLLQSKIGVPFTTCIGAFILAGGLLILGLAKHLGVLLTGVGVTGIGSSLVIPGMPVLLSLFAQKGQVATILALGASSSSAARVAGPFLYGFLFEVRSRLPFYVGAGVSCVTLTILTIYALATLRIRRARERAVLEAAGKRPPPRKPKKKEVHELGHFVSTILVNNGYDRWYEHRSDLNMLVQRAFPPLRRDPIGKLEDLKAVWARSVEHDEEWMDTHRRSSQHEHSKHHHHHHHTL